MNYPASTLVIAALLCALAACSGRQVYDSAVGWRQNECRKMLDNTERAQCMESASKNYDTYSKERGITPDQK